MAVYNWGVDATFKAWQDFSSSQYRFVKAGSISGEITLQATANASCIGVIQNDPKALEEATVRVLGFSKVQADTEAGASPITVGGWVNSASQGTAKGMQGCTNASVFWQGVVIDTAYATGSGAYIQVLLLGPQRTGA